MKQENSTLLLSLLMSKNKSDEHEVTLEDLRYSHCPNVSSCQIKMYSLIIGLLNQGMSYEEIFSFIDNIDINEYKKLNDDAKIYVKMKIKKDVNYRKNNELKNRGVINNE